VSKFSKFSSIGGRGCSLFAAATGREESQPATGDFAIGPGGEDVGAGVQNGVRVSGHDGVSTDIDGENGCEMLQPVDHPSLAVGEISAGKRIESTKKRAADAPDKAMIKAFFPFLDILAARQTHGSPLFNMSNGDSMKSAKKKQIKMGVQVFQVFQVLSFP
jgi:hypothetical protein